MLVHFTPFGSAENIIIANYFDLSLYWHIVYLGVYFVITTIVTLLLLDLFVLRRYIKQRKLSFHGKSPIDKKNAISDKETTVKDRIVFDSTLTSIESKNVQEVKNESQAKTLLQINSDRKIFIKNLIGLIGFIILLSTVPKIIITGPVGLLLFVFLNPIEKRNKKKRPDLSYFLRKIDAKLIYFFICLFILVHILDIIGLVQIVENLIVSWSQHNTILLTIEIMLIVSVLSGFLDDAPVTIMFLPIISQLITQDNFLKTPLLMGFTLGINLGGNFLPQGAACDMMTLELARKDKVEGFTYKSLTIVGGLFALLHILLGIGYVSFVTKLFF